ncbi:hypothetical protein M433DRAFT_104058 [Acidomyces richmondensis BFW]|nr:MAG: hypothetical protein FE78DRAFT_161286 [Acidomyces sp. 'richmondensis']KYG47697.1 hypothetical protein M433DRAFT_104058 [Acidomyces richmondensis BFW]
MHRMGKQQLFRRDFNFIPSVAFVILVQLSWVCFLSANTQGLIDGGIAGLFWSTIWTLVGFLMIISSMAEMASRAPTSGGQYHWVSEYAPPNIQKPLSYFCGWMSVLSWQAGQASSPLLVSGMIQSLISNDNASYDWTNLRSTLIGFPVILIVYILNVYAAHKMPLLQNMMLILYIFGFIVILVTMLVLSPRIQFVDVLTEFSNQGGYSTIGLSLMIGQMTPIFAFLCADSASHLAEEVRDASLTVPRAMFYSFVANAVMGIAMLIAFLVCITDIDAAVNDLTGYPFMWVFRQGMNSAGQNVLACIVILLFFGSTVAFNLSTSRQTFAFARDRGLPFSDWFAKVDSRRQIPHNSIIFTCLFTFVLSLINIGSDTAWGALVSLNVSSLMITYIAAFGCIIWRRIYRPETLPIARWTLGRYGLWINAGAIIYASFAFFWSFWPETLPFEVDTFNWSSVIFVGISLIAIIDYFARGRKHFDGPVTLTEGWRRD